MNTPYHPPKAPFWQQPKKLALIIAIVIGLWVISGVILPSDPGKKEVQPANSANGGANLSVVVKTLEAQEKVREITLNGVSVPQRITLIQAETEGKLLEILHQEGEIVDKGTLIMRLDERDRRNKINEANALLKQRLVELNAAKKLYEKGFQSKVRLSQAETAVAAARTQLKQAQIDLAHSSIEAPYKGLIEEIMVEEGDLIGRGFANQTVLRFVDLSPLKITGQISELERTKISKGDKAKIRFSTGEETTGEVDFIASVSDEETRTFRVEIEVPNPERKLQAGISAEISLQADTQWSYEVPSSVLSLDDVGKVGVKLLQEDNTVKFVPVKVLSQSPNGVWVAGLPNRIRLIMEGGSFVSDGQVIEPSTLVEAQK